MTSAEWYDARNCWHAHCPLECDKPQPATVGDELLCMRCLVMDGVRSVMIPCVPATCKD